MADQYLNNRKEPGECAGAGPTSSPGSRKPGEVEQATDRIHSLANRLEAAVGEIAFLGDRLFVGDKIGQVGPSLIATEAEVVRSGQIGKLNDALDRLDRVVCRAQDHAGALQRL